LVRRIVGGGRKPNEKTVVEDECDMDREKMSEGLV
jgi:hypothetical protein